MDCADSGSAGLGGAISSFSLDGGPAASAVVSHSTFVDNRAVGGTGGYHTRFVILVDEDVNPHDLNEVFEAMGSRCDPGTSLDINRRIWSSRVDPRLEPEKVEKGDFTAS